jgi:hypothetical protein
MSPLFKQVTRIAYAGYVPKDRLDAMLNDSAIHAPEWDQTAEGPESIEEMHDQGDLDLTAANEMK